MSKVNWQKVSATIVLGAVCGASPLLAGGYEIKLWNAESIGEALAGSSVKPGDISTMTRNPAAALAFMQTPYQAAVAANVIVPSVKFTNAGSTHTTGVALTGGNGGDAGKSAVVPAAYAAWNYQKKIQFGLAVTSPWGLETAYNNDWVGRYHSQSSRMRSVNIMPAVAYRVNEQLAIGAGVQLQHMSVELKRAVDFGTIGALAGLPGFAPQRNDGAVKMKGDSWGGGWNVSAFFQPLKNLRFGLSYNSHIQHKLKGRAQFTRPNPGFAADARFQDQSITADVRTPDRVVLGGAYDINPQLTLLGEIVHTQWSVMKEIKTLFPTTVRDADIVPTKWRNTTAYHVGLNWNPLAEWSFRTGYAFDPGPDKDEYRIPNMPGQDKQWAALGATWTPTSIKGLSLSINYAHEFIKNGKSRLIMTPNTPEALRGNLLGEYKTNVNIIAAQLNWRF